MLCHTTVKRPSVPSQHALLWAKRHSFLSRTPASGSHPHPKCTSEAFRQICTAHIFLHEVSGVPSRYWFLFFCLFSYKRFRRSPSARRLWAPLHPAGQTEAGLDQSGQQSGSLCSMAACLRSHRSAAALPNGFFFLWLRIINVPVCKQFFSLLCFYYFFPSWSPKFHGINTIRDAVCLLPLIPWWGSRARVWLRV